MKPYSRQVKIIIQPAVPMQLAKLIRVKAANERRTIGEVSTEALAIGLGLDPATFGIVQSSNLETDRGTAR